MLDKNNIEQNKFRIVLNKKNAIFLINSCVARLFVCSVNPKNFGVLKYGLLIVSFVLMIVLLSDIWFKTERKTRKQIIFKILSFSLLFNIIIFPSCYFAGGFVSFFLGIIVLFLGIKIIE